MGNVSDVCIRFVQPSDRDQLVGLRQALWPKSSAEEHMLDLTVILEGKAPGTMPLIILVAEATNRRLVGFMEVDLRSHADGCNRRARWAISRVGTWQKTTDTEALGESSWRWQKTGRAATGVLRWRRTHGSTMRYPNVCTKHWGTRL